MRPILIYRLGSLGDTLLALPALHLLRRCFPKARIVALTNKPVHTKAAPMLSVLENSGLVDEAIDYPVGLRQWQAVWSLREQIVREKYSLAVNLTAPRGWRKSLRDYLFLKSCGIPRIIGTPWEDEDMASQMDYRSGLYEWEANRLARRISDLGWVDTSDQTMWDLRLTDSEREEADKALAAGGISHGFIAVSVGTKVEVKDWTEPNWIGLIGTLARKYPHMGIVAVGSEEESARTERCFAHWHGPKLNLCGRQSVRVIGAVLRHARVFIGHDSGPMHLAATMGVPCVAIFAARNRPGQWFPRGHQNEVLYNKTDCFGCELETCPVHMKKCIMGITVSQVVAAVERQLPILQVYRPAPAECA